MRIRLGFNIEFDIERDEPDLRESDTYSSTERLPEHEETGYENRISIRAPKETP